MTAGKHPEERPMSITARSVFVVIGALALAGVATAQPSMKMMIPANPGGGWDQTGRQLATAMQSAKLVSGVQFDNKGGAAGTIGLAQFVNSAKGDPNALMVAGMVMAPDGATLAFTGSREGVGFPSAAATCPAPTRSRAPTSCHPTVATCGV